MPENYRRDDGRRNGELQVHAKHPMQTNPTTAPAAVKAHREPERLRQLRSELRRDPELLAEAERVFGKPAPPREPILIRTNARNVGRAIKYALALTVDAIPATLTVLEEKPK